MKFVHLLCISMKSKQSLLTIKRFGFWDYAKGGIRLCGLLPFIFTKI